MALTTLEFRLRDFSNSGIASISEVYFHPVGMSTRAGSSNWPHLYVDRPIKVDLSSSSGLYEVDLEDRHYYRLEVIWHDADRSRVGRSEWHGPFMVPVSGSDETILLSNILDQPPRNGMVRVLDEDPSPSSIFDQYVYNEETGDLFERAAS